MAHNPPPVRGFTADEYEEIIENSTLPPEEETRRRRHLAALREKEAREQALREQQKDMSPDELADIVRDRITGGL